jgi:hypothetical protein
LAREFTQGHDAMPDQPPWSSFFATVYGKLIAALAIIALVLGIVAEGISIYTNWNQAKISDINVTKTKAEECSARIKAAAENMSLNDIAAGFEPDIGDCDPNYKQKQACTAKLAAILDKMEQLSDQELTAQLDRHKTNCPYSAADRKLAAARLAAYKAKLGLQK